MNSISATPKPLDSWLPALLGILALLMLSGCGSRQVQDSLAGSTAQRLVTYSIDDLVGALPQDDFAEWSGRRIFVRSHFLQPTEALHYADRRLALELEKRFDMTPVFDPLEADAILNVFYTSLGTDQSLRGFFLPLGFMPGVEDQTRINLITLEQFHGIAEMYYYIGETGTEHRGEVIQARTRSDAIGLPIITIPVSNIDRR